MNTLLQLAILVINIFIYAGMFYLLYRFVRKIPEIDLYLSQFLLHYSLIINLYLYLLYILCYLNILLLLLNLQILYVHNRSPHLSVVYHKTPQREQKIALRTIKAIFTESVKARWQSTVPRLLLP